MRDLGRMPQNAVHTLHMRYKRVEYATDPLSVFWLYASGRHSPSRRYSCTLKRPLIILLEFNGKSSVRPIVNKRPRRFGLCYFCLAKCQTHVWFERLYMTLS